MYTSYKEGALWNIHMSMSTECHTIRHISLQITVRNHSKATRWKRKLWILAVKLSKLQFTGTGGGCQNQTPSRVGGMSELTHTATHLPKRASKLMHLRIPWGPFAITEHLRPRVLLGPLDLMLTQILNDTASLKAERTTVLIVRMG